MNILEEILEHKEYFVNTKSGLGVMLLNFSKNSVNITQLNTTLKSTYKIRIADFGNSVSICDEEGQVIYFICESLKKELEFYEYGDIIEGPYNLMRADAIY